MELEKKKLLTSWTEVNLITRPRRFGKILNMNMLKTFFEFGTDPALFKGNENQDIRQTYLWSVLFATGYLTAIEKTDNGLYKLVIPNREVCGICTDKIRSWFHTKVTGNSTVWNSFCSAVETGNVTLRLQIQYDFAQSNTPLQAANIKLVTLLNSGVLGLRLCSGRC